MKRYLLVGICVLFVLGMAFSCDGDDQDDENSKSGAEGEGEGEGGSEVEVNTVYPRWVLRDKDGVAVELMFTIRYDLSSDETNLGDIHNNRPAPICFLPYEFSSSPMSSFGYLLETGKYDTRCGVVPESEHSHIISEWGVRDSYMDSDCSGIPYRAGSEMFVVGGTFYATWGEADVLNPEFIYGKNLDGECIEYENDFNVNFWQYREVPSDIINKFADGAPYTMEIEYY